MFMTPELSTRVIIAWFCQCLIRFFINFVQGWSGWVQKRYSLDDYELVFQVNWDLKSSKWHHMRRRDPHHSPKIIIKNGQHFEIIILLLFVISLFLSFDSNWWFYCNNCHVILIIIWSKQLVLAIVLFLIVILWKGVKGFKIKKVSLHVCWWWSSCRIILGSCLQLKYQ